uniref:Uncharacterized protein n=3 Tax=Canis lupus TaxID=9612 RepID=A0A8C0PMY1_CANLF
MSQLLYLLEVAEGPSRCLRVRELELLGKLLPVDSPAAAWLCPGIHTARGQPAMEQCTQQLPEHGNGTGVG